MTCGWIFLGKIWIELRRAHTSCAPWLFTVVIFMASICFSFAETLSTFFLFKEGMVWVVLMSVCISVWVYECYSYSYFLCNYICQLKVCSNFSSKSFGGDEIKSSERPLNGIIRNRNNLEWFPHCCRWISCKLKQRINQEYNCVFKLRLLVDQKFDMWTLDRTSILTFPTS